MVTKARTSLSVTSIHKTHVRNNLVHVDKCSKPLSCSFNDVTVSLDLTYT